MTQTLDMQLEPILEPPSGINGPSNALEWLEPSLLNEALRYLQVESRDEQEIAHAKMFYNYKTRKLITFSYSMGHKLNNISLNVERMNEYLFLNPDGTRSAREQAPDLGTGP